MSSSNICEKHNEQIIAVDCSEQGHDNPLCYKCLAPLLKKSQVVTIDKANETLSNIKQEFSNRLEEQNKNNLDKIKEILSGVIQTKSTLDQQFNKVIENLQSWIINIEKQNTIIKQRVDELSTLKTNEFKQAFSELQQHNQSTIELKSCIQEQLILIWKVDNIQKSLKLLDSIEFIEQNTDCDLINEKEDISIDTQVQPSYQYINT